MKANLKRVNDITIVKNTLKQLLYVLHVQNGYGEKRLLRLLHDWAELQDYIISSDDSNTELLLVDRMLDEVFPAGVVSVIGYEPLKDRKGRIIK